MKLFTKANILGATVAFVIGLGGFLWAMREPTVPLTAADLAAARQRWRGASIRDYDIRYHMQESEYAVRVRDGAVVKAAVDGRPATAADTDSYSVEGIFDVLALDLENTADPNGPFGAQFRNVIVRVRFNDDLGYVERYLRSGGMGRGATIELLSFQPTED